VVISVVARRKEALLERAKALKVPAALLGEVGGRTLEIRLAETAWKWDLTELHDLWWNAIARAMADSH
jgi:hypothetical protein